MARIRTIKPEFPHSESMGRVSRDARLTFLELFTLADDSGRLRGNSRMLASLLFPYDDDAPGLIDRWLAELEREHCIVRYQIEGASYIEICNWLNHQKIDKPTPTKLPAPSRSVANPREDSSEDQGRERIKEGKGEDQSARANVSRGTRDAGTALTGMSQAEQVLAEMSDSWKQDVDGVNSAELQRFFNFAKKHPSKPKDYSPGARIQLAKRLASWGNLDHQRLVVEQCIGEDNVVLYQLKDRPSKHAAESAKLTQATQRKLAEFKARAEKVGFRQPLENEDVLGYGTLVERAENAARSVPRKNGPQPIAKLLGNQPQ